MLKIDDLIWYKDENGKEKKWVVTYEYLIREEQKKNPSFDGNSFHEVDFATPRPMDLLDLKTDKGTIRRGWWTIVRFYGRKLKDNEKVIGWRKNYTDELIIDEEGEIPKSRHPIKH